MIRLLIASTAAATLATAAAAQITGERLTYTVGGTGFEAYVARNADLDATRGIVVIVHDWDGLTEYEERRAEMLAALGYTAFAVDLYGAEADPQSVAEYRELSGALYADRDLFRQRLTASLEEARGLASDAGIVVIGYCFGGAAVLELGRSGAETAGFVSFHGGLDLPEGQDWSAVAAPVLLLHGSADPVSGMEALAATLSGLTGAGVDHDAVVFGNARHSFTVWGSDDYDLEADLGSWQALTEFLETRL